MSRKKAIDKMCRVCIADERGYGNWVQQVTECTDFRCPLFNYRPITKGTIKDARSLVLLARKAEKAHLTDTKKQRGK